MSIKGTSDSLFQDSLLLDQMIAEDNHLEAKSHFKDVIFPTISRGYLTYSRGRTVDVFDFHYLTQRTATFALNYILVNQKTDATVKIITGRGAHNPRGESHIMRNHVLNWAQQNYSSPEHSNTMVKIQKVVPTPANS